jgi:hypothetical protein
MGIDGHGLLSGSVLDGDVTLPGDHPASHAAARWIRDHFRIPDHEMIFDLYEQYFNCCLQDHDPKEPWSAPGLIVFDSPQDLAMFLLKWS